MKILRKITLSVAAIVVVMATTVSLNVTPQHVVLANGQTPIKHLIVLVDENHSFDNFFGTYPNAKGFLPLRGTPAVDGIPSSAFVTGKNGKRFYPYLIQSKSVGPLPHGYFEMVGDYNQGRMNGFVIENQKYITHHPKLYKAISKQHGASKNMYMGEPMGHYDYHLIGPYWDYAQHFTMADHWFQPVFGPTSTNMMYLIAGRAGINGHNVYYTGKPYEQFTFRNIGDEMTNHQVSWTWYQAGWNHNRQNITDNPLMFFRNYKLGKYNKHIKDIRQFNYDLTHNRLPSVTFLKPAGNVDEHPGPGSNISKGVKYTVQLVNQIMASKYWDSTAIILTFDESGGWWDHVSPPQSRHLDGLKGDGPRIPMILISPYVRMNYVSHQIYNSDSILRFIEYNWHLPALTSIDAEANNLLPLFDFQRHNELPFYVNQNKEAPFPGKKRVNVIVNNFDAAQTGTCAPFKYNRKVYMSLKDLARNLNLIVKQNRAGNILTGPQGSVQLSSREMLYDRAGNAYIPIKLVANKLHFTVHQSGQNVYIQYINLSV